MSRVKGTCMGDCSNCPLLENGEVDMIPCILDQIFRRIQRQDIEIRALRQQITDIGKIAFSGVEETEELITHNS